MKNSIVFIAEKYIFDKKRSQWEEDAKKVSDEVLQSTVAIMELMNSGYNFKKIHAAVESISDADTKSRVIKLLTNYADKGPEYAYDRIYKANHGNVDRNSEYVKGLLYKMDENDILRGKERE